MDKQLDRVLPGEILDADIVDSANRLLFSKGAALTSDVMVTLRQRGVTTVSVASVSVVSLSAKMLEKAAELARKYYAGHDIDAPPGSVLLAVRTKAEAVRLEMGRPPLWRDCTVPTGAVLAPAALPLLHPESFLLPELPAIAHELNRVLSSPQPSSQAVVEVISRSPGLTGRLLRLVNSPLYGFQGKIDAVSRAVTIVGMREIGMLAAGLVMVEHFGVIPRNVVDMRSFLKHSLGCALAARAVAEAVGLVDGEQAFVAGLLHDLGRLYFFTAFPERSRFCINSSLKHGRSLLCEERDFFGIDHGAMGQRLLEGWSMPPSLSQAVAHHHDPCRAKSPELPSVVHLADVIAHAASLGCSGECRPPEVCSCIMDLVPLSADGMASIAFGIEERLDAILAAF